jgi:hypothetical protein
MLTVPCAGNRSSSTRPTELATRSIASSLPFTQTLRTLHIAAAAGSAAGSVGVAEGSSGAELVSVGPAVFSGVVGVESVEPSGSVGEEVGGLDGSVVVGDPAEPAGSVGGEESGEPARSPDGDVSEEEESVVVADESVGVSSEVAGSAGVSDEGGVSSTLVVESSVVVVS